MIKKIATLQMILGFASLVFVAICCRDPLIQDQNSQFVDADQFDASLTDDAGSGQLCTNAVLNEFNNSYSPYIGGEKNVELAISHFSYFRCPHCAHFADDVKELWERRSDYRDNVRIYFHHYPFSGSSAFSIHASAATAHLQGMDNFWKMHDFIYAGLLAGDVPDAEELRAYADSTLQLDMLQYDLDYASTQLNAFVQWDKAQGQSAGVTGTPSVFVCGEKISRSKLESIIDEYLY